MWFLILMGTIYAAVNFFLWHRATRYLRHIHGFLGRTPVVVVFTVIYVFFMSSVASWVLFNNPAWVFALKYLSNVWIGVMIYALFFMAIAEVITFVLWALKKMRCGYKGYRKYIVVRGTVVAVLIAGFSLYGIVHAGDITLTKYHVKTDKNLTGYVNEEQTAASPKGKLKIVLVADMHMGYSVGEKHIRKMVNMINDQNPDLVCIAGDIIDNDYYAIRNPEIIQEELSKIKSKYGVYACFGNHDVEEKLIGGFTVARNNKSEIQSQVYDFLENSGIQVLEDTSVNIGNNITLIGRLDMTKPNEDLPAKVDGSVANSKGSNKLRKNINELTRNVESSRLIIDIDHQPAELEEKSAAGVDIDLGGHTHDGQIFPGNLTINLFWENPCGMIKVGNMYSIVTSGVGVWGPAMRVGTNGEVVVINVNGEKAEE